MDVNSKTNQEVLKVLGRSIRQAPEFRGHQRLSADIELSMKMLQHSESVNFDACAVDREVRNTAETIAPPMEELEPSE